jgi:antitoxin VapB
MALQIANPVVVSKVERLVKRTGLSKTAVVDRALDRLIDELGETAEATDQTARLAALLAQLDRIPDLPHASDPLEWDAHGLPT